MNESTEIVPASTVEVNMSAKVIDRFWKYVKKGNEDQCWEWIGSLQAKYGQLCVATNVGFRPVRAHRLAWMIAFGTIPEKMLVLHRCDNPPCCNPAHLFIGTPMDNMVDKREKGRQPRGADIVWSKLDEGKVLEIRTRILRGESQESIASAFNVFKSTISKIKNKVTWTHRK